MAKRVSLGWYPSVLPFGKRSNIYSHLPKVKNIQPEYFSLWQKIYICQISSFKDLIQVHSGQLRHHLKKIISFCKKHVYGCEVSQIWARLHVVHCSRGDIGYLRCIYPKLVFNNLLFRCAVKKGLFVKFARIQK